MKRDTLLIIEDDEASRTMLAGIFQDEYKILEAADGREGIEILKKNIASVAVVLLDYLMPVMDGFQVLERLSEKKLLSKIPFIMVTVENSPELEKKGYEYGIVSFIHKPYRAEVVKQVVNNAVGFFLHKMQLEFVVKNQMEVLKKQNSMLEQQAVRLRRMNEVLIESLSNIVEFRNLESEQHIKRIREFTRCLGTSVMNLYPEYELTPEKLETISWAASLHDIGKIVIPDNIILKAGKLNTDEYEIIKSHTTRGAEIISRVIHIDDEEFHSYALDIARHHHEKFDGNGYPDGLKGEDISIAAQIVSLVDVYDALTSKRVYKDAYDPYKAYHIIVNGQSGVFSPKLLKAFAEVRPNFEKLVKEYSDDN